MARKAKKRGPVAARQRRGMVSGKSLLGILRGDKTVQQMAKAARRSETHIRGMRSALLICGVIKNRKGGGK